MMLTLRGYLRQMRDTQHLAMGRDTTQLQADHFSDAAADANIHFIEHQARDA